MTEKNEYKAITKDSTRKDELYEVQPKPFIEICGMQVRLDLLCSKHFDDRIKNYCHNNTLLDVLKSGAGIEFIHLESITSTLKCDRTNCDETALYGIRRVG